MGTTGLCKMDLSHKALACNGSSKQWNMSLTLGTTNSMSFNSKTQSRPHLFNPVIVTDRAMLTSK